MIFCSMLFALSTNKAGASAAQVRAGGWSEGWYQDTDPNTAKANFQTLCIARATLLPTSGSIVGQRYHVVDGASSTGNIVFPGSSGILCDVPQMALQMSCLGVGTLNNRKWRVRGIPDARVVEGEYVGSQQFDGGIKTYFDTLGQLGFKFKAKDLAAARGEVLTIDNAGNVVMGTPITLTPGDKVDALRILDDAGNAISGTFTVQTVTSGNVFKLGNWPAKAGHAGKLRKSATIYPNVDSSSCRIVLVTVNKVGKSFFQYHGRRSNRR